MIKKNKHIQELNDSFYNNSPSNVPLNRITLRFKDAQMEKFYLNKKYDSYLKFIRFNTALGVILLSVFGWFDYVFLEKQQDLYLFLFVRFFVMVPMAIVGLLLTFSKKIYQVGQIGFFVVLLIIGLSFSFLAISVDPISLNYTHAAIIEISLFGLFLVGLTFLPAAFLSLIITLTYIAVVMSINISFFYKLNMILELLMVCSVGIVGVYISEMISKKLLYQQFLLNQAEKRQRSLEKEKIIWLENIARFLRHELNNRLVGIDKSLELLNRHIENKAAIKYLDRARQGTAFMDYLLESVAEATSMEASFEKDQFEIINLSELLTEHIKEYQENFSYISINIEPSLMVNGNDVRLKQLIDKLISNALDFRIQETVIVVRLERHDHIVILEVENEGPPLPENIDSMFELFSSLRTHKSTNHNMGLGLYVTRLIAQRHGGTISARNKVFPTGAVFAVKLPLVS